MYYYPLFIKLLHCSEIHLLALKEQKQQHRATPYVYYTARHSALKGRKHSSNLKPNPKHIFPRNLLYTFSKMP